MFFLNCRFLTEVYWFLVFFTWIPVIFGRGVLPLYGDHETDLFVLLSQHWYFHQTLGIFTIIALLQFLITIRLRIGEFIVPTIFSIFSCSNYLYNNIIEWSPFLFGMYFLYACLFIFSLIIFIWRGHLISPSFVLFLIVVFIDAAMSHVRIGFFHNDLNSFSAIDMMFQNFSHSIISIVTFVFAVISVKLIYLYWYHNQYLIYQLKHQNVIKLVMQTLLIWWPMPIIFLGLITGYQYLYSSANKRLSNELFFEAFEGQFVYDFTSFAETTQTMVEIRTKQYGISTMEELEFNLVREDFMRLGTPYFRRYLEPFGQTYQETINSLVSGLLTDGNSDSKTIQDALRGEFPEDYHVKFDRAINQLNALDSWKFLNLAIGEQAVDFLIKLELLEGIAMFEKMTLEDVLQYYTAIKLDVYARIVRKELDGIVSDLTEQPGMEPDELKITLDKRIGKTLPGTSKNRCGFFDVSCFFLNRVKSTINRKFRSIREEAIETIKEDLSSADSNAKKRARLLRGTVRKSEKEFHDNVNNLLQLSIERLFTFAAAASQLMFLYSLLILIKSFMIIFARVLFDLRRHNPMLAQFQFDIGSNVLAKITRHNSSLGVSKVTLDDLYFCYEDVQIAGVTPDKKFPLGFRYFLPRLLSGRFSFRLIKGRRSDFDAQISVTKAKEIVQWDLQDNEVVVFRWSDMIGFSKGTNFRRIVSCSLPALIFGKIVFYCAEGPGTIFLKTSSEVDVGATEEQRRPIIPDSLVAWNAQIKFHLDARHSTLNAFLSFYNIIVENGCSYVRDTGDERARGVSGGILRFVKSFLLPF